MASIGKVSAVFTASSSGLVSSVNQSARALGRLQASVNSVASSSRALVAIQGAQLFGSVVSGAANYARSLVNMGSAQAQVIDQQSKMADRLGMTYGELAGIGHAANLSGVSMEAVAGAATKADVALVKAVNGSASAAAQFTNMGLSIDQLNKMNAADRFKAIADGIAQLPSQAERSAAAVGLFGRAGAQLLPLFSGGASAIAATANEAERLGLTLKNAQSKDVEAMNDAFTRAGEAVKGIVGQVVSRLAPAVTAVSDVFTGMIGSAGGANIGQTVASALMSGARYFAGIGDWFISNMGSVWSYVSSIWEQAGTVVDYMSRTGSFFQAVWEGAKLIFFSAARVWGTVIEKLASVGDTIGSYLGFDTSSIKNIVEGAKAFNAEIDKNIVASATNSAAAFQRAFGDNAAPIGQAVAGPLTTALDAAISKAQSSANATDVSPGSQITPNKNAAVEAASERQAVKAIDSRSSEGLAEMFRLMRGRPNGAAERTAVGVENMNGTLDRILTAVDDDVMLALE